MMETINTTPVARGRARSTRTELTETEIVEAVAQFHLGTGVVAMARELNVQPSYLSNILKQRGCDIRKGRPVSSNNAAVVMQMITPEIREELVQKYQANIRLRALSRETGFPTKVISQVLKEEGVDVSRGKPKALVTA
jgi:hypothetical protein